MSTEHRWNSVNDISRAMLFESISLKAYGSRSIAIRRELKFLKSIRLTTRIQICQCIKWTIANFAQYIPLY
jgi:hypothetical protein